MQNRKINVLIVDDSVFFNELLYRLISKDIDLNVAAKAYNSYEARDKIIQFRPDVMICDIEMPKMDGIEFIKKLIPQYPIPVIAVSGMKNAAIGALSAGAVDFIAKPDIMSPENLSSFAHIIVQKIKAAAKTDVKNNIQSRKKLFNTVFENNEYNDDRIIAIGSSTGGTEALYSILKSMDTDVPGIVIVQHIPPVFSKMFADRLDKSTGFSVKEAETGDYVKRGNVYIAPGDKHIRIKKISGRYKIECFSGEKVNGHCPSADVLFKSVANEAKEKAIGVILTGMGCDGAAGLLSMRRMGAHTIGQDKDTCVVYGMPKAAYDIGAVEVQTPLGSIHNVICSIVSKG